MKTFKLIDVWISAGLIIVFTFVSLIRADSTFFIGYFVTGAWQVVSMLAHAFTGWFCEKGGARINYHWAVLIIMVVTLLGLVVYPLLYLLLFVLLFAAPVMAVGYTYICYQEVYVKMKRPLDFLK